MATDIRSYLDTIGHGWLEKFLSHRIADPRLTYQVWASDDLANWGEAPIWSSTGTANTEGIVEIEDATASPSRRFLVLKVLSLD